MVGNTPFAELYRRLMKEAIGRRDDWVRSRKPPGRPAPASDLGKSWVPKDIARALGVDVRTAQTWSARKNPQEPSESNLLKLERLFFGDAPHPDQRDAFRAALQSQYQFRKEREAGESWDISERGSPYRGIAASLTDRDAAVFFGRRAQMNALISKVQSCSCVFVVGASGAGKSSLVWAGLIPSLLRGNAIPGSAGWIWTRLTPGGPTEPLRALLGALAAQTTPAADSEQPACRDSDRIPQAVDDALAGRPGDPKLLLFI